MALDRAEQAGIARCQDHGAITWSRKPDAAPRSLAPASRRHREPSQCRALRALPIARGGAARLYLFYHRQQIGRKASAFALLEAMPALRLVEPRPTELHANPSMRSRTRATS